MEKTYEFYVSTRYIGSEVKDEISISFDDDATEDDIEREVEEVWVDWRNNVCEGGWIIIE